VIAKRHLVLFFSLVQITIKHLQNSVLGVHLAIMVLLEDLNFLLQLLRLRQPKDFSPMGQNFHAIQMRQLLFFEHLRFEIVAFLFHLIFFVFECLQILLFLFFEFESYNAALGLVDRSAAFHFFSKFYHLNL